MGAIEPFVLLRGGLAAFPRASRQPPDPSAPPPLSIAASGRLLGDFAAMLLLVPTEAGADKAQELDGELLAWCAEAEAADLAAERAMDGVDALPFGHPAMDAALTAAGPLLTTYADAVAEAAALPARTPEGLRAKAGLLLRDTRSGMDCAELAASLARDIRGRG